MKCIVVYDSTYGNTEKIAISIARALGSKVIKAGEASSGELAGRDIVFVGSPTHGGRPTEKIQKFIDNLPSGKYPNLRAAVFDTRVKYEEQNFALKLLLKIIGYASPKMGDALKKKGIEIIEPIGWFYVNSKEGPLASSELERAVDWAKTIIKKKI